MRASPYNPTQSEQSRDVPLVVHVDLLRRGNLGKPGHRHNVPRQRHHESRARGHARTCMGILEIRQHTAQRPSSEQPRNVPLVVHVDLLRRGNLGKPGHRHNVPRQRHHESRARGHARTCMGILEIRQHTAQRPSSEQPRNVPLVVHVDLLRRGNLGKPGHRHNVPRQRHHESRARGHAQRAHGDLEIRRRTEQCGLV